MGTSTSWLARIDAGADRATSRHGSCCQSQGGMIAPKPPAGAGGRDQQLSGVHGGIDLSPRSRTTAPCRPFGPFARWMRARSWMKGGNVGLLQPPACRCSRNCLGMITHSCGDGSSMPEVARISRQRFPDLIGLGGPFVHDLAWARRPPSNVTRRLFRQARCSAADSQVVSSSSRPRSS